jgi:hypothetical protein
VSNAKWNITEMIADAGESVQCQAFHKAASSWQWTEKKGWKSTVHTAGDFKFMDDHIGIIVWIPRSKSDAFIARKEQEAKAGGQ